MSAMRRIARSDPMSTILNERFGRGLTNGAAPVVGAPPEAGGVGFGRQWCTPPGADRGLKVVLRRCDVVRRFGVEQRRQVLKLPAARALLEHAAAIDADAALLAVVVGVKEGAQAAKSGGLHVEHARSPRQPLDVGDRVDRLVPGDSVAVALEQRLDARL